MSARSKGRSRTGDAAATRRATQRAQHDRPQPHGAEGFVRPDRLRSSGGVSRSPPQDALLRWVNAAPLMPVTEHVDHLAPAIGANSCKRGAPDGPPIVLIHGWSQNHLCWAHQYDSQPERPRAFCTSSEPHSLSDDVERPDAAAAAPVDGSTLDPLAVASDVEYLAGPRISHVPRTEHVGAVLERRGRPGLPRPPPPAVSMRLSPVSWASKTRGPCATRRIADRPAGLRYPGPLARRHREALLTASVACIREQRREASLTPNAIERPCGRTNDPILTVNSAFVGPVDTEEHPNDVLIRAPAFRRRADVSAGAFDAAPEAGRRLGDARSLWWVTDTGRSCRTPSPRPRPAG